MWLTAPNRIGIAAWQTGDALWRIAAGGHAQGVSIQVGDEAIELAGDGGCVLPRLQEQFVRGDELHLSFPQTGDGVEFGLRLVIRPLTNVEMQCGSQRAAFEWLISIQTTLLDTHPAIALQLLDSGETQIVKLADSECCAKTLQRDDVSVAVILGPQDAFSLVDSDSPNDRVVKLFGEFLEKGVIRRARPWVLVNRSSGGIEDSWLATAAAALLKSPLPLE